MFPSFYAPQADLGFECKSEHLGVQNSRIKVAICFSDEIQRETEFTRRSGRHFFAGSRQASGELGLPRNT